MHDSSYKPTCHLKCQKIPETIRSGSSFFKIQLTTISFFISFTFIPLNAFAAFLSETGGLPDFKWL